MIVETDRMALPSASVAGRRCGKAQLAPQEDRQVCSVPERKKASTNSSNEMVKQSSRLETMPGMREREGHAPEGHPAVLAEIGDGFLQALVEAFQARDQHQHGEGHAEQHMAGADRQQRQLDVEECARRMTSSATPRMMLGMTSGSMIAPMTGPRARQAVARHAPSPPSRPSAVLSTDTTMPTMTLLRRARPAARISLGHCLRSGAA